MNLNVAKDFCLIKWNDLRKNTDKIVKEIIKEKQEEHPNLKIDKDWVHVSEIYAILRVDLPEEVTAFANFCAYCQLFRDKSGKQGEIKVMYCFGCPIRPEADEMTNHRAGCLIDDHPYQIWHDNPTNENAEFVYQLIHKS